MWGVIWGKGILTYVGIAILKAINSLKTFALQILLTQYQLYSYTGDRLIEDLRKTKHGHLRFELR